MSFVRNVHESAIDIEVGITPIKSSDSVTTVLCESQVTSTARDNRLYAIRKYPLRKGTSILEENSSNNSCISVRCLLS